MKHYNYPYFLINVNRLLKATLSSFLFILCFVAVIPSQPSLDAIERVSISQNELNFSNAMMVFTNEPFSIFIASFITSPITFQISYAFFSLLFCSFILRIPLFYLGIFILTPPGYLLAFNITPSLIAFSVVNYHLFISEKLNKKWIIFGVLNHLVAALSVARFFIKLALGYSILKKFIIAFAISVLYLITYPILQPKLFLYMNSVGNQLHIILAMILLFVLVFNKNSAIRFSCFFYLFVLGASSVLSSKIASRMAFGADLLIFHIVYLHVRNYLRQLLRIR